MWHVAFKIGSVWLALIVMFVLCVFGQWPALISDVWPRSPSDWATWVGSLGTLAAVIWAVWQWRRDRREAEAEKNALKEKLLRQRQALAWTKAMIIRPRWRIAATKFLVLSEYLNAVQNASKSSPPPNPPNDTWLISELEEIFRGVDEALLSEPFGDDLAEFFGECHLHNEIIRSKLKRSTYFTWNVLDVEHCRAISVLNERAQRIDEGLKAIAARKPIPD